MRAPSDKAAHLARGLDGQTSIPDAIVHVLQKFEIRDEYVRKGVVEIFMEVEPLASKRHVAICERRTRKDWAQQINQMQDERYP